MKVCYAGMSVPERDAGRVVRNSIFLAGPTPRSSDVKSWRPGALEILTELGFGGIVFVPETSKWAWCQDYQEQITWEWTALGRSACVLFWIPRELGKMPGFTTNVEFGFMMGLHPERCVLGAPNDAEKIRYLRAMAAQINTFQRCFDPRAPEFPHVDQTRDLRQCLSLAMRKAEADV